MHQIGKLFTRLQPGIVFTKADLQASGNSVPGQTSCILGQVPQSFEGIHSQALINAWYHKLQTAVQSPVQIEQRKGRRRVSTLGCVIYEFDAAGQLKIFVWTFDGDARVKLKELAAEVVVAQGAPYRALWMNGYREGALRALRLEHPDQVAQCQAYVDWVHGEMIARCWDQATQDRVRYEIAVSLDLDVQALKQACQIQLTAQPARQVLVCQYNHALKYAKDYEVLSLEAPQLIPLYSLIAADLEELDPQAELELTARLRGYLLHEGFKPSLWRLLVKSGTAWMTEALAFYLHVADRPASTAKDLLCCVQAFGARQLAPSWLLHAFLQLGGNPNARSMNIARKLAYMFPLCARLGHLAAQAAQEGPASLELFQERAQSILNWASDYLLANRQWKVRKLSLETLIRMTDEHYTQNVLRLANAPRWTVPYTVTLQEPDMQAVILDSALALWQEGRTMRHCVDKYVDNCERGDWLILSLRKDKVRRPLATVAIDLRSKTAMLTKISGFANSLVDKEVYRLAQDCTRQIQTQHRLLQSKEQHSATA